MSQEILNKLFHWKKEIQLVDTKFYVRIVSDAIVEEARRQSLLDSRRLRKNLRDSDSDDYLLYIDPVNDFEIEDIQNALMNLHSRDVAREFMQNNPKPPLTELGDYPSQEEQENLEAEKIERDENYAEQMVSYIEKWRDDFLKSIQNKTREELIRMYARIRTDRVCEEAFNNTFEDRVISQAVFIDEDYTKNAFTYEEYKSLPSVVKAAFRRTYDELSVSTEDIKN